MTRRTLEGHDPKLNLRLRGEFHFLSLRMSSSRHSATISLLLNWRPHGHFCLSNSGLVLALCSLLLYSPSLPVPPSVFPSLRFRVFSFSLALLCSLYVSSGTFVLILYSRLSLFLLYYTILSDLRFLYLSSLSLLSLCLFLYVSFYSLLPSLCFSFPLPSLRLCFFSISLPLLCFLCVSCVFVFVSGCFSLQPSHSNLRALLACVVLSCFRYSWRFLKD